MQELKKLSQLCAALAQGRTKTNTAVKLALAAQAAGRPQPHYLLPVACVRTRAGCEFFFTAAQIEAAERRHHASAAGFGPDYP